MTVNWPYRIQFADNELSNIMTNFGAFSPLQIDRSGIVFQMYNIKYIGKYLKMPEKWWLDLKAENELFFPSQTIFALHISGYHLFMTLVQHHRKE